VLRDARRRIHALRRAGEPLVHYFHDPTDPYSHLTEQILPALTDRYRIGLHRHLVPPPNQAAAPDAARLAAWSRRDAAMLARTHNLNPPPGTTPAIHPDQAAMIEGAALRRRLGHYLGATFYFEGEWYWGLDRLHYLETRLTQKGWNKTPNSPLIIPPRDITLTGPADTARGTTLHMFLSLRSPYSYIALPRAQSLASHYGAELRLRPVLPMVMRGLPVPAAKRFYILLDTKREAERLNLPFGKIADPVGKGVECGLAVLHHAIAQDNGETFALAFLQAVFAKGIDAATGKGLAQIAGSAGITAAHVHAALSDETWREAAQANRAEMLDAGLWGVPCFRVNDGSMVWGQDRLWCIEERLRQESASF
jgi:2-hydroxychromene-2-carboxylate isomerase